MGFKLDQYGQDGTERGDGEQKIKEGLTTGAWSESTYIRTGLGREDEGDATEIVIQVDDRADVVLSSYIDPAHQFEFWTDLEDATIGSK